MILLTTQSLNITTLVRTFWREISLTWLLTIIETALLALIPLLIGFAIDGLLNKDSTSLMHLGIAFASLITVGVIRRLYDTRVYSKIRVRMGESMAERMQNRSISSLNARLGMGRELVDFLETTAPEVMTSAIQLIISLVILYSFHPMLATFAFCAAVLMILLYGVFHKQFYRFNGAINQQVEQQVRVLETKSKIKISSHLNKLRDSEIKLSDTESILYGAIFTILLGFIIFNLWFAANEIEVSPGQIFSIVTYSWEFVDSALALPMALQLWTRLSEITIRINK